MQGFDLEIRVIGWFEEPIGKSASQRSQTVGIILLLFID
jgi:hypothetical protein